MRSFSYDQFVRMASGLEWAVVVLWLGLGALTAALVILSRTRWGQSRPLRKCIVLSVLVHLLFAGYATTVKIVAGLPARDPEPIVHLSLDDGNPWQARLPEAGAERPRPWASHQQSTAAPESLELERVDGLENDQPDRRSRAPQPGLPTPLPLDELAEQGPVTPDPQTLPSPSPVEQIASTREAHPIDASAPQRREPSADPLPQPVERIDQPVSSAPPDPQRAPPEGSATSLVEQGVPLPQLEEAPVAVEPSPVLVGQEATPATSFHGDPADLERSLDANAAAQTPWTPSPDARTAAEWVRPSPRIASVQVPGLVEVMPVREGGESVGTPILASARQRQTAEDLPRVYRLRVAPNRSEIALRHGATTETEAAVRSALRWLADNQLSDGRWSPTQDGGEEQRVHGRDRFNAGAHADTGISGLALLTFLAAGHTHQEGLYCDTVRRGVEFLLQSQASDGNLGGKAGMYGFMYCHAMATIALCEAYGMTGDTRLEGPVRRAVMYTITAQNPSTGGWRYKPRDEGDTSQLGWQLMALRSAELAGIPMPEHTRQGALRFLKSVSSGRSGGLAAYRPVERASRAMTAEAMASRHFLGLRPDSLADREAAEYLLGELPGEGEANLYYWYYATLSLNQLQGDAWERWNAALKRELLARQVASGELAGSWHPNTVWGGYGGRVYATALATLCLEVYYRFMPLYADAASQR